VAQTVQRYFDGLDRGDTTLLRQAFHPTAVLYSVRNDSLVTLTQPAWFARMRPRDAAAPPAGTTHRITQVDVAGNAASARAETVSPEGRTVDYLSLLRVNGQWRIVNKIFYRELTQQAVR
jgi:hypothetical protein